MRNIQFRAASYAFVLLILTLLLVGSRVDLRAADCTKTSFGLVPFNDLGSGFYQGYQGGLYPGGTNVRPIGHEMAGIQQAQLIQPLDANGQPSASGQIVLVSIGMSTTEKIFDTFKTTADADPVKNPKLVIVNGAKTGAQAKRWADPTLRAFDGVDLKLAVAGVSGPQVQAAWVKVTDKGTSLPFPADVQTLQSRLTSIAQNIKSKYPNVRLAYFSSRMYGGYTTKTGTGEPFSYETALAVKGVVADQIGGSPSLNFDPAAGVVKAPWIAWGPYTWADGVNPRSDGLFYVCSDFEADGYHPAKGTGREKVTALLLDFFKNDSTARGWFLGP